MSAVSNPYIFNIDNNYNSYSEISREPYFNANFWIMPGTGNNGVYGYVSEEFINLTDSGFTSSFGRDIGSYITCGISGPNPGIGVQLLAIYTSIDTFYVTVGDKDIKWPQTLTVSFRNSDNYIDFEFSKNPLTLNLLDDNSNIAFKTYTSTDKLVEVYYELFKYGATNDKVDLM